MNLNHQEPFSNQPKHVLLFHSLLIPLLGMLSITDTFPRANRNLPGTNDSTALCNLAFKLITFRAQPSLCTEYCRDAQMYRLEAATALLVLLVALRLHGTLLGNRK